MTEPPDFLTPSLQRIAQGCTWPEFADWFAQHFAASLGDTDAQQPGLESHRFAIAIARGIFSQTPDPQQGWRARKLPQPARNDPCYCGSGRKYKQCCQLLALPPLQLDAEPLGAALFVEGPAAWRDPAALRRMPPHLLAAAAHAWGERHGPLALGDLLEPLFLAPAGLDERCEPAWDLLMDALLDQRLDARREQVARAVITHGTDRRLRGSAHCRLAAMLSDRGAYAPAWEFFDAARREDADNPELLHLELTLLLAQGRLTEAAARTPLLAARARKLGYPELAEALVQLQQAGPGALMQGLEGDPHAEEAAWVALLREARAQLDPARFVQAHDVGMRQDHGAHAELSVTVRKTVQRRLKAWSGRFAPAEPMLTMTTSDADALLDEPGDALRWLQQHPDCACTVTVLDDVLLAARQMVEEAAGAKVMESARALAYAAAELVTSVLATWPQARMEWVELANRPVLRIVAQAIEFAMESSDAQRAEDWMRWMMERNPTDNHGWRELLRVLLLRRGDAAGALAILEAYPGDAPPSEHDRALALYLLGRTAEAEQVLREAHAEWPAFVAALLPETTDGPAPGAGHVAVGGAEQAWYWRENVREAWVAGGAIAWLRALELPAAPARRRKPATRTPTKRAGPAATKVRKEASRPSALADVEVLRRVYGDELPWVLGWLAGSAWAPGMVHPTAWVATAMERAGAHPDGAGVQQLLDALMNRYNAFNEQRLAARPADAVPLPPELQPDDDAAWASFAAGFLQMAEQHAAAVWRATGATVRAAKGPFAPLYQLAARAPAAPDSWRPSGDEGQPLLALAGDQAAASELLAAALLPLWRLTLAARE